jgi:putative oxygen-independent coproporphyrinogen III oxidase
MQNLPPLSLYIHIPWCVRKCPYCDFNSHAVTGGLPEAGYVAALLSDLEQDLPRVAGRVVQTVFIGGGTPSLFSPESIRALLQGIAKRVPMDPHAEITLEANPGTAESGKFRGFREAGVNRLSMGVQSFNDRHLQALGRIHDSHQAKVAADLATAAGFDNCNLDLMFGLPRQTQDEALDDIRQALQLNPTHLSFYQLTLEPNTLFHKHPPVLPGDDAIWATQVACQALLDAMGYRQYEVSAYAKAGFRCRHNENYWRFGDYLGIGAGAHGKLTDESGKITRTWKIRHPAHYLGAAGTVAIIGGCDALASEELPVEFMMNHLRLREGFVETVFTDRTGLPMSALEPALSLCLEAGLLERTDGFIRCTGQGWNFLDNVLERFIARV